MLHKVQQLLLFFVAVNRLKITRPLEPVEVDEEGTAEFSCELNHEASSVQWLLNEMVIHSNHINKIQNSGNVYSLVLKRLSPQESRVTFKTVGVTESTVLRVKGEDYVIIYSLWEKAPWETYVSCLRCSERPVVFLRSLEDVEAEEGGKVCLQCEVSKRAVTPVWRRDGTTLRASEKHQILHSGTSLSLIVHELRRDDAGEYSCDVGTSQSKAHVVVRGKSNLDSEWVFGSETGSFFSS